MSTLVLLRKSTSDEGTFGRLYYNNLFWYTGELPWRENKGSLSCIPEGSYKCAWTYSPTFKRFMYGVNGVSQRTGIRIHSANYMGDKTKGLRCHLLGCIALGKVIGIMDKQKALLLSRPAISEFEIAMKREPFIIEVKNEFT